MKRSPEFLVWKIRDRMTLCGVMQNPVIEQFCLVFSLDPGGEDEHKMSGWNSVLK